jgi:hypothetical protein
MNQSIKLDVSADDEDVAYLMLPGHVGAGTPGAVVRQIRLSTIVEYKGADIYLDFDKNDCLVGIEILA